MSCVSRPNHDTKREQFLQPGLLEQCCHNALYYELAGLGLQVGYNTPYTVFFKVSPAAGWDIYSTFKTSGWSLSGWCCDEGFFKVCSFIRNQSFGLNRERCYGLYSSRIIYAILSEVWTIMKFSSFVFHSIHLQFLNALLQDHSHLEAPTRIVRNYQKIQKVSRLYLLLFSVDLVRSVKYVFVVFLFLLLICMQ